jgi:hypothetical protein
MKSLKNNHKLGIALSIVGILTGFLILYLMASIYNVNIEGDEAITVQIVFAMLGWLGVSAGALWVAVLYGFLNKANWAWFWGTVAATVQLLVGFFPIIPPASIGLPTPTIWVFLIAFTLWFGMLFIGGVDLKIIALAFVSGLPLPDRIRRFCERYVRHVANGQLVGRGGLGYLYLCAGQT